MKKLLYLSMLVVSVQGFAQFLHRDGQNIKDGNGNNIILRGLGLGGWMVQEGYMLQTSDFAGPQHKIREKITQLIGETNTEAFYQAYRDNGITKRDIDSLKAWGFNSIRLPMHYNLYTLPIEQETGSQNTWLDEGFQRTDLLLQWCAENEMYLILDMHAAPGGQGKDANISDYDETKPSLWESDANKQKLIALWREIADRYKDNPWIGGYDLINEPNWNFTGTNANGCDENSNAPLRALMVAITNAIREVDNNHMIIAAGNCWGNNYNGMFPVWDNNMILSFHKYWNSNSVGAIQGILNLRTQHNVPIWLGESGENSNVWFRDAISLMETNNIGWAWWPMKKVDNIAGIASVTKTPAYQQLIDYWKNGGTQPTQAFATATLMQLAENYKMQNVNLKYDVIDAMFRQVQTNETIPYAQHTLPGKVYATEFDMGTVGHAYWDTDVANYRIDTGTFTDWNRGWSMRNDGVDIEPCNDTSTNGYQVGFIMPNEWLVFTLTSPGVLAYDIDIRYAGGGGKIFLEDGEGRISETITLPSSGGFTTWATVTLTDVILKSGVNKVKVFFEQAGFNLNYLEFKNPRATNLVALKVIDASTSVLGDAINLTFNKALQSGINFTQSNLTLKVNGTNVAVTQIAFQGTGNKSIRLKPATAINAGQTVTVSYSGSNLTAVDNTTHTTFTDKPVQNKVGNIIGISGQVETENFWTNSGFSLENANDVGGGQNVSYADAGDTLEYLVNVAEAGTYSIQYRTSGESATGSVLLQLINENTFDVQTVSLPPTGGWQNWSTVTTQAVLLQGRYYLRLTVLAPGFNLNWIKFSYLPPDDDGDNVANANDNCPNTPPGDVVDFSGCTLFSLPHDNFAILTSSETCRNANNGSIAIQATATHNYVATLSDGGGTQPFTSTTEFENLPSGNYTLCITLPEAPAYQQCFDLFIAQPPDLSVMSRVLENSFKLKLDFSGGTVYHIDLNGIRYMTVGNSMILDLKAGRNDLTVTSEQECRGVYKTSILIDDSILLYPNPVASELNVIMPVQKSQNVKLTVFSLLGEQVISREVRTQDQNVTLDLSGLAAGTYALQVVADHAVFNRKIVKQ